MIVQGEGIGWIGESQGRVKMGERCDNHRADGDQHNHKQDVGDDTDRFDAAVESEEYEANQRE